ncbi:MAG TPA: hypothetical protein VMF66_21090 [Candidatus Acidoferrum sp.]|nr:hypothetical protein [Candidatus Acidoferrum sp.]
MALILFTIGWPVHGQTAAGFQSKYQQVISYRIRPGVLARPAYTSGGRVCKVVVEKEPIDNGEIVFGSSFSHAEAEEIVNELAPAAERGRNLTGPLNTTIDGGFVETDYSYEHIVVREFGVTRPAVHPAVFIMISWRDRTCASARR